MGTCQFGSDKAPEAAGPRLLCNRASECGSRPHGFCALSQSSRMPALRPSTKAAAASKHRCIKLRRSRALARSGRLRRPPSAASLAILGSSLLSQAVFSTTSRPSSKPFASLATTTRPSPASNAVEKNAAAPPRGRRTTAAANGNGAGRRPTCSLVLNVLWFLSAIRFSGLVPCSVWRQTQ